VVICNLHIDWTVLGPNEANAILIIYAAPELPFPLPGQSFQSIARRNPKFVYRLNGIQLVQLSESDTPEILRADLHRTLGKFAVEYILSGFVLE
jgi:hypothetical protein